MVQTKISNTAVKTLKIDGKDVSAREGETIIELARENGIFIPTLCYLEGLSTLGACRMCLVEVAGSPKLFPACTTQVEEGMQIVTNSERILKYRKTILSMMFAERNHICAVCVTNGHCELQDTAQKIDMDHITVPYIFPKVTVDATHKRFVVDHNRCILCQRCVRVCDEIEGAHTWDLMGRGHKTRVITDFNQPWGDSESCTSCGKCVQICPVGALFEKGSSVAEMHKRRGFLPYLQTMRDKS